MDSGSAEDIHIVLTGDHNYVDPLVVTMTSILLNIEQGSNVNFHLFMKGINQDDESVLSSVSLIKTCKVDIYHMEEYEHYLSEVDVSTFKNSYINIVCYYRLLMVKLLPSHVNKCFYIDGDMIINTDLSGIYKSMDDADIISAVVEIFAMEKREEILEHVYSWPEFKNFVSAPESHPYFNAGFFLLNIQLARKVGLWDKFMHFFKEHPNPPYADQDILNGVIGQGNIGHINFLSPHYNVFCDFNIDYGYYFTRSYYNPDEILDSFKFAKIMHYAGGNKPWNYCNCHYYNEWWNYAAKSPVAGRLLLKSQETHAELCKKLYYTMYENEQIQNKLNSAVQHLSLSTKFRNWAYKVDPVVESRYNKFLVKNKCSKFRKTYELLKYRHEALCGVNSDHYTDFNNIKRQILRSKIISFDIFDTLLCRPFVEPVDLFRYIEKKYSANGFYENRISAERKCREYYSDLADISLSQIYEFVSDNFKNLYSIEISEEFNLLFPNKKVVELLKFAKLNGKKVIITSDMYLSSEILTQILNEKDIFFDEIFVSCDINAMKMKGTMFPYIIDQLNVDPSQILHIGDNLHSDYLMPKNAGLNAIRITKNTDALLESDSRIQKLWDSDKTLESSALIAAISTFRWDDFDYWTDFGLKYAGPVILSYVLWLSKSISMDDNTAVYFVARDGYTLKKAFDYITGAKIKTYYIYSPRHISSLCNMDIEEKLSTDLKEADSAVKTLIQYYNKCNGTNCTFDCFEDSVEFVRSHIDTIKELADLERQRYSEYLSSISNLKNIALIDTITIHFSSQKLLSESLPNCNIHGYYWTVVSNEFNSDKLIKYPYSMFQSEMGFKIADWDIMEFFITSPESPILDIDPNGKPIYKNPNKYDKIRSEVYPLLSEGSLELVKKFVSLFPNLDISPSAELVNSYLNILCDTPTSIDKKKMSSIMHAYDSENTKYVPIFKTWYQN